MQRINVRLLITDFCSQHCKHCEFSRIYSKNKNFIDLAKIKRLSTFLSQLAPDIEIHLTLSGGEPLEHPEILSIVDLLAQANLTHIRMATNLTPLIEEKFPQETFFKILGKIQELVVSTETSQRTYVELRKSNQRDEVLDYLENIKNTLIDHKMIVSANVLASKSTIDELAENYFKVLLQDFHFIRVIRFFSEPTSTLPD